MQNIAPAKLSSSQNEYSLNYFLIILLVCGAIAFITFSFLWVIAIIIVSAIAVFLDAKGNHAGFDHNIKTESGDPSSWSPLSWGLTVLLLWIIGLPLYLIMRKEIWIQKNRRINEAYNLIHN